MADTDESQSGDAAEAFAELAVCRAAASKVKKEQHCSVVVPPS
jgi:hypothetical protein